MLTQPKILVCTDFSQMSDRALLAANSLAEKTHGQIHLLHVAEVAFYTNWVSAGSKNEGSINHFHELIHLDLMQRMNEQMKRCGVKATPMVFFEHKAEKGIEKVAAELKTDLIVIGSRGHKGLERIMTGSLARKLAFHSEIPLLVIKNENPLGSFAALVSREEDISAVLPLARDVSQLYASRLHVISVCPKVPGLYFGSALEYSTYLVPNYEEDIKQYNNKMQKNIMAALGDTKAHVLATSAFDVPKAIVEALEGQQLTTAILKRSNKNWGDRLLERSVSAEILDKFSGNFLFC